MASALTADGSERSQDTVLLHPHDYFRKEQLPIKLPHDVLVELSKISPTKAVVAITLEWVSMGVAIWLVDTFWHPLLMIPLVFFIAARQFSLSIIGHDAGHFRLFSNRRVNDVVSDLLCWWPIFFTLKKFRHWHGAHHKYFNSDKDGNIPVYGTHDATGQLHRDWVYPKSLGSLVVLLLKKSSGFYGWRGWRMKAAALWEIVAVFRDEHVAYNVMRLCYYVLAAAAITYFGVWKQFFLYWMLPQCTWYFGLTTIRLALEHYGIPQGGASIHYDATRTTIPTFFDRVFLLPNNISYHTEHHFFPSIPFYNLPKLHEYLITQPDYLSGARVYRGALSVVKAQLIRPAVQG